MCETCYKQYVTPDDSNDNINKNNEIIIDPRICKTHNLVFRTKNIPNLFVCDICETIILGNERYHILMADKSSKNVCILCEKTSENARAYIKLFSLKLTKNNFNHDIFEFGNLMDWIPIIYDEYGNMVLFNYNSDSKYAGRFALASTDNNGRIGYFIMKQNTKIDNICKTLQNYFNNNNLPIDQWNKFYNCPIKQLMKSLNMPIHFS